MAGVGNWLNFDERMYNPRIARFPTRDPLTKMLPFQSPYIFAGNSPICQIDYNGTVQIIVTKGAQAAGINQLVLQNFTRVAANLSKLVGSNDAILLELSRQTGFKPDEIKSWLVYGEGPPVYITGAGGAGTTGANGFKSGVYMDASLIKHIASFSETDDYYEAMLLATGMTLLHELTHYGDEMTNNGRKTRGTSGNLGLQNYPSTFKHRGMDVDHAVIGSSEGIVSTFKQTDGSYTFDKAALYQIQERLARKDGFYRGLYQQAIQSFKNDNPPIDRTILDGKGNSPQKGRDIIIDGTNYGNTNSSR